METLQIRKKAVKTWWHIPSDQKEYAVSKLYCKFNGEWFRVVEQGGRQRGEYHYSQITVFDDTQGGSAETFASPLALFLRLEALEYVGFEWGSGGGGVGFQPQIIAPQDGQVITYDNGIWQNGFLDLQGNRFIQTQDIPPIEDNILTVPFGFVWILNTITYSNLTDWTNTIPFTSSEEMVRTDIIVAIASNTFVRIQGEENDGFPIQPTLPPNSLLVTSIDVYHDSFGTPTEPITGNQFIKKSSEAFVQVVPTEEEFKLNIDNHRNFVVNSALEQTTIVGISKTTSNGSTSTDTNWSGSDLHIYRKIGSGALKIKHHSIPDFAAWGYTLYFPDGEDYDVEEGELLTFKIMQPGTLITNSSIMAFPIYIFAGSSKVGGGGITALTGDVIAGSDGVTTLEKISSIAEAGKDQIPKVLPGGTIEGEDVMELWVYDDTVTPYDLTDLQTNYPTSAGRFQGFEVRCRLLTPPTTYRKESENDSVWIKIEGSNVV